MNGSRLLAVTLIGLLVVPAVALAKNAGRERRAGPMRATTLDQSQVIDVNQINMIVTNFGSFAYDVAGGHSGLEYPKGSGKTAVYAGGLWLGGKIDTVTKVAITAYSNEWFPGPIGLGGVPDDPDLPIHRVYKLNRVYADDAARDAALGEYNTGALPYGADTVTVQGDGSLNILGDQLTWCVYNEADSVRKATSEEDAGHTGPMGIEVQQTIFAFNRLGALGQTVFLRYRMINKGGNHIDSMYVSVWSDPDLGDFGDDLVGCDISRSMGFVYNATNDDGIYGIGPPAVGYDFFRGPIGYAGTQLGLNSFNKYVNEVGSDPDHWSHVYNFMRGLNRDGTPVVNPVNGQVTTFVVNGDPVNATGWLDASPADRRLMLSSGPFQMAPLDTQEVVVGIVIGDCGNRLRSISSLRFYDLFAQSAFDQNFDLAPPPASPEVVATWSENSAILTWDRSSEAYNEPPYAWEGYVVYQGASRSGPWTRLATFDLDNGIQTVLDDDLDQFCLAILPTIKALGTDRGVGYRYEATTDAIRGGPLLVGTPYYFAVSSYAVGPLQTPRVLESSNIFDVDPDRTTVYTVIPQTPVAGVDLPSAGVISGPTQGLDVPGASLPTTDDITVDVVDPMRLLTATYRLGYKPDATGVLGWYVVRTMGAAVDTILNNETNFSGDDVYPVFDGLQVKISGAPPGNLLRVTYTNVGPNPPSYVGFGGGLGMPFFDGSADYAYNTQQVLGGLSSKLLPSDPSQFTTVELRLTGGAAGQKAYRYRQSDPPPRTYPYFDYVDVPFTVWDIEGNRQLNCGLFEFDGDAPDGVWNPDFLPDPFAKREWLYVFQSAYSGATPDPLYTTTFPNARTYADSLDFMYVLWCAQAQDGGGAPIPADAGDIVTFLRAARSTNNYFAFSTKTAERANVAAAQSEFSRIRAVPNPYFAHSRYEFTQFNRVVKFTHLPARCTIRIFNLAGDLVRTLEKDDAVSSQTTWDLLTTAALPVASGIYVFHVDAPGFGTHVGKVAIFMEKERLNTF